MRNRDRGLSSNASFKAATRPQTQPETTKVYEHESGDRKWIMVIVSIVLLFVFGGLVNTAGGIDTNLTVSMIAFVVCFIVGLIPSFVAYKRKHKFLPLIVVLNVLVCWTVIGWFILLAWSFCTNNKHGE